MARFIKHKQKLKRAKNIELECEKIGKGKERDRGREKRGAYSLSDSRNCFQ